MLVLSLRMRPEPDIIFNLFAGRSAANNPPAARFLKLDDLEAVVDVVRATDSFLENRKRLRGAA